MSERRPITGQLVEPWTRSGSPAASLIVAVMLLAACGQVITPSPTEVPPSPTPTRAVAQSSDHRPPGTDEFVPPLDTAVPAAAATPIIHVVQQGDTLQAIAFDYGVRVDALQRANGIENPQLLQIGQQLIIPLSQDEGFRAPSLLLPTPTPQPVQLEGAGFFRTPVGSLWGLGEVSNTTTVTLANVQVHVMLFDVAGALVAEGDTFVAADLIPPGERSPFGLLFTAPPDWASYQMTVLRADDAGSLANAYLPLSLTDLDGSPIESQFKVSGSVEHVGPEQVVKAVHIIVTTYNAEGTVTGFREDTLHVDEGLTPGAALPFTVLLTTHAGSPDSYSVMALAPVSGP